MQEISTRLATLLNNKEQPFGGMNMIFAGDFAQLPPVVGKEKGALYSRNAGLYSANKKDQIAAIGKALWHQITTVVILRENMRLKGQSLDNAKFRTALENMRYKACTLEDISFLKTLRHTTNAGKEKLKDICFRDVSIITTYNISRDAINELGCLRFAKSTNQDLFTFYSNDTITDDPASKPKKGVRRKFVNALSENVQSALWNMPLSSNTKKIAPKLTLCYGLPVMIRRNFATELCITNGQEGTVYGWDTMVGNKNQTVLKTLFILLTNPPKNVHFDGLPINVVPVPQTTTVTDCHLPSDAHIWISRTQVEIVPNFAMTDFASQGKTRGHNLVHIRDSVTHQAIYTALSRGTSAEGTVILDSFTESLITGGCSGALRQ
ncbi:hypothetical protein BDN72DRAFT_762143, partial [Pluteus cervinus]